MRFPLRSLTLAIAAIVSSAIASTAAARTLEIRFSMGRVTFQDRGVRRGLGGTHTPYAGIIGFIGRLYRPTGGAGSGNRSGRPRVGNGVRPVSVGSIAAPARSP